MSSIKKNGNIEAIIFESSAQNILLGTNYTLESPYVVTGTGTDIYVTTDKYAQVTPGATYYLTCKTDKGWSPGHIHANGIGKGTIWLYLSTTYNPSNMGYNSPICFSSSNWISKGVWKYTIPSGYNMARIRLNGYSDGTNSMTNKFWDIHLIPQRYYTETMRIANEDVTVTEIMEE